LGAVCFARGRGARIPADALVVGVLLGALATHAVRYQTWFALGVAPLLALALTHIRPGRGMQRPPRAILARTPEAMFTRFVSQPAVRTSAAYAAAHPHVRILADDVTGSELLWQYPALA